MSNIYEVAKLAGVSLATVSRVLNGKTTVNPAFREKVEKAMAELNYRPSPVARSLATNRSDSIGLLIAELNTPFFGELMKSVESTLRAANKHVIITVGHHDLETELDGIDFLISRQCDALILHVEALSDEQLTHINESKLPIALVNRLVPDLNEACIRLDNEKGGYLATRHLLDNGHRSIAYIAGPQDKEDAQQRFLGHQKALKEAGIPLNPELIYQGDFTEESGDLGLAHLLHNAPHFTAVVCGNDWMASGAINRARELGIDMPKALSVIGFDDVLFAHHLYPKLTTIRNPIDEMGKMAAEYILQKVYKQERTIQNVFEPQLVERQSTGKPGGD